MYARYSPRRICCRCVDDPDLAAFIRAASGPRGCSFCGRRDATTIEYHEFVDYVREHLESNYSKAADELPWESAEGGYQGWTSDTHDLLFDTVGLDLPRDTGDQLRWDLANEIGDETWCEFDWLVLNPDDSLEYSWDQFCSIVKTRRRFFFHNVGAGNGSDDPDSRSPLEFLSEICSYIDAHGLIKSLVAGQRMYRARPRSIGERHRTPASLGPPPPEFATQSNRMNPPGISMFYGADRRSLAVAETRNERVSLGTFEALRDIRLLDLAHLPKQPGFFSDVPRTERLRLKFIRAFAKMIVEPVERNNRVNVDYVPTQVFTEYLRDYPFSGGPIDGVRYRSATGQKGTNVVLFAAPENIEGAATISPYLPQDVWLRLVSSRHLRPV